MNKYYLNMFENLGYSIYNSQTKPLHIYHKNTLDELEYQRVVDFYDRYFDKNKKCVISLDKVMNTIVYDENIWFNIDNMLHGDESQIYDVSLCNTGRAPVTINVAQYTPDVNNLSSPIYTIKVDIGGRDFHGESTLTINQELDHITIITKYGNNEFTRGIPAEAITSDNLIKIIWEYLNNYDHKSYDDVTTDKEKKAYVLKSFKLILPSFKMCLNDVITYWKKIVLPCTIQRKKDELATLPEDELETRYMQYDISDLEDVDRKINRR